MLLISQVAANTRGIQLVGELITEYGLPVVTAYMRHIQVQRGWWRAALVSPWSQLGGQPDLHACLCPAQPSAQPQL